VPAILPAMPALPSARTDDGQTIRGESAITGTEAAIFLDLPTIR
jgi:hypothetical protein